MTLNSRILVSQVGTPFYLLTNPFGEIPRQPANLQPGHLLEFLIHPWDGVMSKTDMMCLPPQGVQGPATEVDT